MSTGILPEDHVHCEPFMSKCYSCSLQSEPQIASGQCYTFPTKVDCKFKMMLTNKSLDTALSHVDTANPTSFS